MSEFSKYCRTSTFFFNFMNKRNNFDICVIFILVHILEGTIFRYYICMDNQGLNSDCLMQPSFKCNATCASKYLGTISYYFKKIYNKNVVYYGFEAGPVCILVEVIPRHSGKCECLHVLRAHFDLYFVHLAL